MNNFQCDKVLRAVFVLVFVFVLASCPMPTPMPTPMPQSSVVDADGDGLIEISSLEMLHNMRYNLAGSSYKTSANGTGNSSGCPSTGCVGYELTQNLNFDTEEESTEDTSTWTGDSSAGFTLDSDDDNDTYFDVDAGGWLPIGDEDNPFAGTFEGNGHTISNLAIQRDTRYIGLFGAIDARDAAIRNIGLTRNLADYSGNSNDEIYVGGLVGAQFDGEISASYVTGTADGGAGDKDYIGGLVGYQVDGITIASHTIGDSTSGDGSYDSVGGLTGLQSGGEIIASYAIGTANGGGDYDRVGGLLGFQENGSISTSYAIVNVAGGDGNDTIGGLVGGQENGVITASYAVGNADGGAGDDDYVGGLIGWQLDGSITASYATGVANGGPGDGDYVGGLAGVQEDEGEIDSSYGFATPVGETPRSEDALPEGISTARELELSHVGNVWHNASKNTFNAWHFGTASQTPVLRYADYDDSGAIYLCDMFPRGKCGDIIPGQGR